MSKLLGEIDLKKKPVKPELFLCKPNKSIVAKMSESYDINFDQKLGTLNEINFKLPIYIDKRHRLQRNPNADMVSGRYLVKLKLGYYEEYFIITKVDKVAGNDYHKSIQALSLGFELNDKTIRDYSVTSKNSTELLTDVLKDTIWSIGYIDSEFDLKYRSFEVSSNTVLEVVFDIAKTFNALVVWDTLKRKIHFYRPDLFGSNKGLKIKYGKYLESLNEEENSEETVTRLKIFGSDDKSIHEVNPVGTSYIEDFSYFIHPYSEKKNYQIENIDYNDVINNWTNLNCTNQDWIIENGKLKLKTNGGFMTKINPSAFNYKNYKLNAKFRMTSGDDDGVGFVFRYKDTQNYYYIIYDSGGLGFTPYHFRLYKVQNGVSTLLKQVHSSNVPKWVLETDYKIEIEVVNNLLIVKLNDQQIIYHYDNNPIEEGSYGFFGQSQIVLFSDIFFQKKDYEVLSHSNYMSDELCHFLLEYDSLLQEKRTVFSELLKEKREQQDILSEKESELFALDSELKIILDERDVANSMGWDSSEIISRKVAKESEINAKALEIDNVNAEIDSIKDDINKLGQLLSVQNNFTLELVKERNQYIIEKEWQDQNIEDPDDLLEEGIKVFAEMREPKITLRIDVVNLLEMVTEQRNWDKLVLSDIVEIEHEKLNVSFTAKITEINYDFEKSSIGIVISNVKDLTSNKDQFLNMLYNSYSTSTTVNIDKWKWDLSLENRGSINDIINNKWDATKQSVEGGYEQLVSISDRGIIIKSLQDPLSWLVIQNGMLAITNDGGNTWKHSVNKDGIVGERIYGKVIMGVNLAIEDESGIIKFRGSRGYIYDNLGNEVIRLGLVEEAPDEAPQDDWGFILKNSINKVYMTKRRGFEITRKEGASWVTKFKADLDGGLYAEDITTKNLKIVDGELGEKIIFDENDGITINGNNGEQIRLNANEGIAIDVDNKPRFWVGTDGRLYARQLIITPDDPNELINLPDGSFVSDLTVNSLRSMNSESPQDYVHIRDNYIQFLTGAGSNTDIEKFRIWLEGTGYGGYPVIKMGAGTGSNDNEVAYLKKDGEGFKIDYKTFAGDARAFHILDGNDYGFKMMSTNGKVYLSSDANFIQIKNDQILIQCGTSSITLSPTGVKISGARIDLN